MEEFIVVEESKQPQSGGYLRFYGLYWDRNYVNFGANLLPGLPNGWIGRGTKGLDKNRLWMNFWGQKGVYVLYDEDLMPVYSGQAGLKKGKSKKSGGRTLGERLRDHRFGKYRNGWKFFSWFGFLDCIDEEKIKGKLKTLADDEGLQFRANPNWEFRSLPNDDELELNGLLDSFEAVLIEAFIPRFNSRGGNLKGSVYVDQFEGIPAFIQEMQK